VKTTRRSFIVAAILSPLAAAAAALAARPLPAASRIPWREALARTLRAGDGSLIIPPGELPRGPRDGKTSAPRAAGHRSDTACPGDRLLMPNAYEAGDAHA
jgi:hypothetical protein